MFNADSESSCLVITHKEKEILKQLRALCEADRCEIYKRFLEKALKYEERRNN